MHNSRLSLALRLALRLAFQQLLHSQRVGALGTLAANGTPSVSMVPFAVDAAQGWLVIHVSALAAHTGNLLARPALSLMVMQAETTGEPVHALPRISLNGHADVLAPNSSAWSTSRSAYLQRFPEAEPITQLGDFTFMALHITSAIQIAGFGAARSVERDELDAAFRAEAD